MAEFLFYKTVRRRSRRERLHDMLVAAKEGLGKTRIMHRANLSSGPMNKLLKFAKEAGLIEEIETPRRGRYRSKRPETIWKTTEKGCKYAQNVYDNSKLLQEAEGLTKRETK